MAHREGFLRMPLVNRWADELKEVMRIHYPEIEFSTKEFRHLVTIDVDVPFAFLDRSLVRTTLSVGKDIVSGKFKNIRKRVGVLRGKQPDPFDTYHFITSAVEPHGKAIQWFWHTGNFGRYDKSLRIDKPMVREAIQKLAENYPVGIHPSYQSFHDPVKLHEEIERLKNVLGQPVTQSRQHYLRITFPFTYQNLIEEGIQEDYSMGYSSEPGFRASICTPFPFYNLEKDETTSLMIFPFEFMDGTFLRKKMDDREMEETITYMSRQVRQTGGFFSGLWHNSTFGNEDSYRMKMFFERIVSEC
ncbi:MAG TPA: polysaccharide deacetylase family protein [Bacteroidales bacterium]|nr:polysaccharide deacetylase family protein [Bacteroidales bacterium]